MAFAITVIEGDFNISDADLERLVANQQVSIGKVKGDFNVYQESWTAEQVTEFKRKALTASESST